MVEGPIAASEPIKPTAVPEGDRVKIGGFSTEQKTIIYGRDTCPFCVQAREAYGDRTVYVDIEKNPEKLQEMLYYSKGDERIPVIVEGERVLIGFNKDVFLKGGILLHGGRHMRGR